MFEYKFKGRQGNRDHEDFFIDGLKSLSSEDQKTRIDLSNIAKLDKRFVVRILKAAYSPTRKIKTSDEIFAFFVRDPSNAKLFNLAYYAVVGERKAQERLERQKREKEKDDTKVCPDGFMEPSVEHVEHHEPSLEPEAHTMYWLGD